MERAGLGPRGICVAQIFQFLFALVSADTDIFGEDIMLDSEIHLRVVQITWSFI